MSADRPDWHTTQNGLVDRFKNDSIPYKTASAYASEIDADSEASRRNFLRLLYREEKALNEKNESEELAEIIRKAAFIARVNVSWQKEVLKELFEGVKRERLIFLQELVENQKELLGKEELLRFLQYYL